MQSAARHSEIASSLALLAMTVVQGSRNDGGSKNLSLRAAKGGEDVLSLVK
jgi:hypothetical protein